MKVVKTECSFGVFAKHFKTKNNLYCVTVNVHTKELFIEKNGEPIASNLPYCPTKQVVNILKKQLNIKPIARVAVYSLPIKTKNKFTIKQKAVV